MRRLILSVVTAAAVATAAPATAAFSSTDAASGELTTATLQPPTSPHATLGTCSTATGDEIVVGWTASASTFADGYHVWRSTAAGGPYEHIATVAGRDTTSYLDTGLTYAQTFYYVIRSSVSGWTSVFSAEVNATTRTSTCT